MSERNPGCDLDLAWINKVNVNLNAVNQAAKDIVISRDLTSQEYRVAWYLKAITCIDLTTLSGNDTASNVARMCLKAVHPVSDDLLEEMGFKSGPDCPIRTAAVCVYPSRVADAVKALKQLNFLDKMNVASVATGFPSGQMPLRTRLEEVKYAVENGATEIDIVLDRSLVLTGKWEEVYSEVRQMKESCGPKAHMKTILAVGELDTLDNVYKASLVAMMAGSDFIKTSTGKEAVNATLPVGVVMCRAIREYYDRTGYKVGLKPAGGIKTSQDALSWLILIKELLGVEWLTSELFRFGASGLLGDLEQELHKCVTGYTPAPYELMMG